MHVTYYPFKIFYYSLRPDYSFSFSLITWSSGLQFHCKLPSLPCSSLDVSDDSDRSCCNIPTHTINPTKHSLTCIPCGQGGCQKKFLSHFLSTCPKFHHARTVVHNQVCRLLAASRCKHFAAHCLLERTDIIACPHCNCTAVEYAAAGRVHTTIA